MVKIFYQLINISDKINAFKNLAWLRPWSWRYACNHHGCPLSWMRSHRNFNQRRKLNHRKHHPKRPEHFMLNQENINCCRQRSLTAFSCNSLDCPRNSWRIRPRRNRINQTQCIKSRANHLKSILLHLHQTYVTAWTNRFRSYRCKYKSGHLAQSFPSYQKQNQENHNHGWCHWVRKLVTGRWVQSFSWPWSCCYRIQLWHSRQCNPSRSFAYSIDYIGNFWGIRKNEKRFQQKAYETDALFPS